ncbi:GNAT family N-acetyltransferase [Dactylosporangium vinaceum]|uniref:GNAT family N-acetyltransferase n=1 Tax=Dactylosporangium vinaceum TaxID=53362 RepID=A0ABV5M8Z9_9ACTN|nr:GNAT family protein [Dactylosporangium vinaceum]UAB99496.1 GNAT family N-acetyltransferase [Dactylosporangium vinaceum]
MRELERLAAGHAAAVLAFEVANRAWFAATISDRGEDYFARFAEHFAADLADQDAGTCAFYLRLDAHGAVLARCNLYNLGDGTADLGYRVAQHAAGRGVATAAVLELCALARDRLQLRTLRAAVSERNTASQRVLRKAGFAATGPADPAELGGKPGTRYALDLTPPAPG